MKFFRAIASVSAPHAALKFCLLLALALSAAMAFTGDYNRHPDEVHHFLAAKYYTNHFLPPEIGDSAVRDSYSVYGVSYLNYHWAEYFLAGKFARLVSPLIADQLIGVRLFNVFLFSLLIILFLYRSQTANQEFIIFCFLLITPQIWYVFSYANNDAFALFVFLLIADQIACKTSYLNGFLQSENLSGGVLFGLLAGFLLIAKTNFYAFLLFAGLWLAFDFSDARKFPPQINFRFLKKSLLIALTAISVLAFRCALDFYVNGETNFVAVSYLNYFSGNFEAKKSRLLAYQEEIAERPYKPSTIENNLAETDSSLKLKAKGASYKEIFTKWRWHEISFKSFVGVYGYMTIFAPENYYRLMGALYFVFGLFLVISIFLARQPAGTLQLSVFTICAALTAFVSSYLSWTYAFQAQGRYLFPVVPMLGLLVYSNRERLNNLCVKVFIFAAFALSVYSFVFVALLRINAP